MPSVPFIEMSVGLEERSDFEAMACLAVVMLVGDAGDCPLTDTGLSYESIVVFGEYKETIEKRRGRERAGKEKASVVRKLVSNVGWWFCSRNLCSVPPLFDLTISGSRSS